MREQGFEATLLEDLSLLLKVYAKPFRDHDADIVKRLLYVPPHKRAKFKGATYGVVSIF